MKFVIITILTIFVGLSIVKADNPDSTLSDTSKFVTKDPRQALIDTMPYGYQLVTDGFVLKKRKYDFSTTGAKKTSLSKRINVKSQQFKLNRLARKKGKLEKKAYPQGKDLKLILTVENGKPVNFFQKQRYYFLKNKYIRRQKKIDKIDKKAILLVQDPKVRKRIKKHAKQTKKRYKKRHRMYLKRRIKNKIKRLWKIL